MAYGKGDCNSNGVSDAADLRAGTSDDCNTNGVPDECDVAGGTGDDCQPDGVPDECQLTGGTYPDSLAQDNCVDAEPICPGNVYTGTTTGKNNDGSASCGSSSSTEDVWYGYTPSWSGPATFSLCGGTSYDSVLSVHSNCPGTSSNQLGCDDDGCGSAGGPSLVTHYVGAGTTYYVRVSGWNGSDGSFALEITGPDCVMADNDCNANVVPDECDIASGYSWDTNGNGIPDECEGP
jgi:hypothetical protein